MVQRASISSHLTEQEICKLNDFISAKTWRIHASIAAIRQHRFNFQDNLHRHCHFQNV